MTDKQCTEFPSAKKAKLQEDNSKIIQRGVTEAIPSIAEEANTQNNETEETAQRDEIGGSSNELERLREFNVLDEVNSNDGDSDCENCDSFDGKPEILPEEEIERMIEEDLPELFKGAPKPKETNYIKKQKTVLEAKGVNMFEDLPVDWVCVRHSSGVPLYVHRPSHVCTLAKPYFIGELNVTNHEIPLSAIPCLAYRRALDEEEQQKEIDKLIEEQIIAQNIQPKKLIINNNNEVSEVTNNGVKSIVLETNEQSTNQENLTGQAIDEVNKGNSKLRCPLNGKIVSSENSDFQKINSKNNGGHPSVAAENDIVNDEELNRQQPLVLPGGRVMPPPKVESVDAKHLTHDEVTDYCKRLFKFKSLDSMYFNSWAERREYRKARMALRHRAQVLPAGTRLVTVPRPAQGPDNSNNEAKRCWVMKVNRRNYLCEFQHYVKRVLKEQPVFEFKQLENSKCQHHATVSIGGVQYGAGSGTNKRRAKQAAVREAFCVLIPDLRRELDQPEQHQDDSHLTFFEQVSIEDPRVTKLCNAAGEPTPRALLQTCLLRNFGADKQHIRIEVKELEKQKIQLTMKIGKHTATVECRSKKMAKQRASQSLLQALHPQIHAWGSILRLYGSPSVQSYKEKKMEEKQITLLQHEPNKGVIQKLRDEMRKLSDRDKAVVPVGTLRVEDNRPPHSDSDLNNVDL